MALGTIRSPREEAGKGKKDDAEKRRSARRLTPRSGEVQEADAEERGSARC